MQNSAFHCVAEEYRKQGYSVIPLVARSKRVIIKEWSRYCNELADEDTFNHWMAWPESNIGLCLGSASGVFALDYDIDRNGIHKQIQGIVPVSPCVKRGAKGFTAFYRFEGQRSAGYKSDGVTVIDILAGGKQTVIPPSRHPDGMDYEWEGLSLLQVKRDELPSITASQMAEVGRLFKTHEPRYTPVDFNFDSDADIDTALQYVRADDYDTWVRMGMALKDHLGEAGYGLWDGWSSRGSKYGGSGETRKKWQSFKSQGISVATVFYEAMQAGFKPKPQPLPERFKVIESGGNMTEIKKQEENYPFLDNIPGLPGLIAEHINASAGYKQPLLTLGSALATAGAIMGGKVELAKFGLRTNIYTLGIGEASSGKDWSQKCAKAILHKCNLGDLEMGAPKSGAALINSLHKKNGVAVSFIDEFGHFFSKFSGKNVPAHIREIMQAWLSLYSSAKGEFNGGEYANNDGKTPTKIIMNPCFSMFPLTTPRTFYGSITGDNVEDGLMSRFLIFETKDYPTKWDNQRDVDDIPAALRDQIETWKSRGQPEGNMPGPAVAKIIPFDDDALAYFINYTEKKKEKAKALIRIGSRSQSVYGRAGEGVARLALIAHEGNSVSLKTLLWAIEVSEYCCGILIDAIENKVSDNDTERMSKEIVEYVRSLGESKAATRSQLALRFRKIERRVRSALLDDLTESGILGMSEIDGKGKKKIIVYYINTEET